MPDSSGASHHGSLRHSHSGPLTPGGSSMGGLGSECARTPPATPKKAGKILAVRVQMLDDSVTMLQVQAKALAKLLFDQVCRQLNLLESDYFGLEYTDLNTGTKVFFLYLSELFLFQKIDLLPSRKKFNNFQNC
jgi:FERM, RhoGEF and pleckstrin domain protein 2